MTLRKPIFILTIAVLILFSLVVLRRIWKQPPSPTSGTLSGQQQTYQHGDWRESITVDGRERTYLLHIPTKFDPDQRRSLVVVLHGTFGTGDKVEGQTGFSELADKEGFIVVYPDALANWNDGRGTSDAAKKGVDDISFIKNLVFELQRKLPVDESRIYAAGVSSGGIMTYRLGCETSLFAAIAPVIANIAESIANTCNPVPTALIAINGVEDPFVPFNGGECCKTPRGGGEGGKVISNQKSLEIFAQSNVCSLSPKKEMLPVLVEDGTSVEKKTYASCKDEKDIIAYAIHGGGHAWPPNPPQAPRMTGASSQNIDATQVIWEFFEGQAK